VQIDKLLKNLPGSGAELANIATAFGLEPAQAEAATQQLAQAVADRIERNTLSRGGLADVVDLITRPGAGRALADPSQIASPQTAQAGNGVLDVLFGNKHASRGIADRVSRETGVDSETLKKMLPAVAGLVIGALQDKALPQIEKVASAVPQALAGSPLPLPGEPPRAPTGGSTGGNWTVDVPDPAPSGSAPARRGRPLNLPGGDGDIPGADDGPSRYPRLPDIVRDGRANVPGPQGGSLDDLIRNILGNLLGFKNGGVMSWIIKYVLYRVVSSVLRRVFGGR